MGLLRPSRIAAFLLAIVIGLTAIAYQVDRHVRINPQLAGLVPFGLGGFADEQRGRLALANDPPKAGPFLEAVIRSRPVDVSHLSLLAAWAAEVDKMDLAGAALTEAATRGWRDPYVQISVLGSAAATGEFEGAAQRLDALARAEADPEILRRSIDVLISFPEARPELARQISASEYLGNVFVDYFEERPASATLAAGLVADMTRRNLPFDCDKRARATRVLLRQGQSAASQVWLPSCRDRGAGSLAFDWPGDESDPFDWEFSTQAGLAVRRGSSPGSISVNNRNLLRSVFATRYLMLPAGSREIRLTDEDVGSAPGIAGGAADFVAVLLCLSPGRSADRVLGRVESVETLSAVIPADCPIQQVRMQAGRGRIKDLTISTN